MLGLECTPVIPQSTQRLRQEDWELKSSLNYIMRSCLRKRKRNVPSFADKANSGP